MKTKTVMTVFAVLMALALVLPASAKGLVTYTFDSSVKPFSIASDDLSKSCVMSHQTEDASPFGGVPNGIVAIKTIATSTQSAVWMYAQTELNLEAGSNDINLSLQAKDLSGCKTCIPVAYIGTTAPVKASQFTDMLSSQNPLLGPNWGTLHHHATIKVAESTPLFVAVGWRVKDDMLKKVGAVGFDNISVTVAPTP